MCGIFGAVIGAQSELRRPAPLGRCINRLFELSESRGKEAAGLVLANASELSVYKAPVSAREMTRAAAYRQLVREAARPKNGDPLAFIGHSRLVTDGGRETNRNNQPVLTGGVAGIHNGIIVNHGALWDRHRQLTRQFEVDSEVIFALLRQGLSQGLDPMAAARQTFSEIQGAASIAALFDDLDVLLLATNNGSLYYRAAPSQRAFFFASESYIMDRFADSYPELLGGSETTHVRSGTGMLLSLSSFAIEPFGLAKPNGKGVAAPAALAPREVRRTIADRAAPDPVPAPLPRSAEPVDFAELARRFPYRSMKERLRRCRRCVLPETMPFVDFDADGVCAYCRNHQPLEVSGRDALEQIVAPHRRSDGRPDCLVGVSGGRDSIYGLHYLKTVLGLNPVAYTYDWGMVTDLARRNTSRICAKLGIEHILVSADIPKKREYIRANVEAWLARPSLGTIPLFMAGDKAYFHYFARVREQLGVKLSFMCENLLERTDFKTGFAGLSPVIHDRNHVYTLPVSHKLKLAAFYGREFISNHLYLNESLLDNAKAFAYYYMIKRDYHNLYRYVQWDEQIVADTLLGQYDFERAEDTDTLWRIGDGTAAFYNYIYHALAGMTENDTFRSNQIRNGAIDRATALARVEHENRPRFPSIQWYLQTIGLQRSVPEVLEIIERAPKLYSRTSGNGAH